MTRLRAFFGSKRRRLLIPLFLLLIVLVGGLTWCHLNQARIYLFTLRHKSYDEPALTVTEVVSEYAYSRDDFFLLDHVTLCDSLMLINNDHPLPKEFRPQLSEYNGAKMNPLMIEAYIAMRDETEHLTGDRIYVTSDYRTREEQEELSREEDSDLAAKAGCSEHESGLALDIAIKGHGGITFIECAAGLHIQKHCHEYGFVIRYPYQKSDVTGIRYEPWHVRYVGLPHATVMTESNLTLEEYLVYLVPDQWYSTGSYLILRTASETVPVPREAWDSCTVSPDNMGNYIYTFHLT